MLKKIFIDFLESCAGLLFMIGVLVVFILIISPKATMYFGELDKCPNIDLKDVIADIKCSSNGVCKYEIIGYLK